MSEKISCFDCKFYDMYDVNDYEIERFCNHDIPNKIDESTSDVHPKMGCVMFEIKNNNSIEESK